VVTSTDVDGVPALPTRSAEDWGDPGLLMDPRWYGDRGGSWGVHGSELQAVITARFVFLRSRLVRREIFPFARASPTKTHDVESSTDATQRPNHAMQRTAVRLLRKLRVER